MYKHCNTEESARRQRQLEQCLLELMKENSYNSITIGQICQQADVSRKSFYRYFDSKEGCLFALLDHTIMDCAAHYMPDQKPDPTSVDLCIRIFEYWQQHRTLLDVLEKNGMSLYLLQRIVRHIIEEEPDYVRYMGISPDCLMEHAVYSVGGLMGLILTWHHEGYPKSAAQMGQILHQLTSKEANP